MKYRPISCLENPVSARWGPYDEDDDDRRERVAEENREARRVEALAALGLSRPVIEGSDDMRAFLVELAEGVRGA